MPVSQAFVLMSSDLVATAMSRDSAQGAVQQSLYDEFFATCSVHGAAKRRGQQVEATDLSAGSALDGLAPIHWRVALLDPLVDRLD